MNTHKDFQTEIEAAGKQPLDLEALSKAQSIDFELCSIAHKTRESRNIEGIYTLLLRIRDLEAQVEQERWAPVSEKIPKLGDEVFALDGKTAYKAFLGKKGWWTLDDDGDCNRKIFPTHWKPINLPA